MNKLQIDKDTSELFLEIKKHYLLKVSKYQKSLHNMENRFIRLVAQKDNLVDIDEQKRNRQKRIKVDYVIAKIKNEIKYSSALINQVDIVLNQ